MTRLVLILLLANALMFGWNRGWFDGTGGAAGGPAEENAHRLRPVPLSRLDPPQTERESAARPASGTPTPQPSQPPPQRTAPPAPLPPAQAPSPVPQAPPASTPATPGPSPSEARGPTAPTSAEPAAGQSPSTTQSPAPAQSPGSAQSPAPVPAQSPAAEPAQAPAPDGGASASSVGFVAAACRAFPPIDEARATALRSALEQSGARVEAHRIEQGSSYLVYLPPAPSVPETQRRLVELRRSGRDDAFVIQDGPMRLAISLGLFRFESAARAMAEQLARDGEPRAMVVPRPPIQVRIALQARWSQPESGAIATMLGAQFDAAARDCD